jgi:hypothetical protein
MKSVFDLHPAAVASSLLAGSPRAAAAQRDAEPEDDTIAIESPRRFVGPLLAFHRRRDAAAAARSANA